MFLRLVLTRKPIRLCVPRVKHFEIRLDNLLVSVVCILERGEHYNKNIPFRKDFLMSFQWFLKLDPLKGGWACHFMFASEISSHSKEHEWSRNDDERDGGDRWCNQDRLNEKPTTQTFQSHILQRILLSEYTSFENSFIFMYFE